MALVDKAALEKLQDEWKDRSFDQTLSPIASKIPLVGGVSGARCNLVISQITQAIPIRNPDSPRIFTGDENMDVPHLASCKAIDHPIEICDVVDKYPGNSNILNKTIVFRYLDGPNRDSFDMTVLRDFYRTSTGFAYPLTVPDNLLPNQRISPNEDKKPKYLFRPSSVDSMGNYRYGKNLKYALVSTAEVKEDGLEISESAARMLEYQKVDKHEIRILPNEVFRNAYGDRDRFRAFPDIGEKVEEYIAIKGTLDSYEEDIGMMYNNIQSSIYGDCVYVTGGSGNSIIADIEVYTNDLDSLKNRRMEQVLYYYSINRNYYERLGEVLKKKFSKTVSPLIEQTYRRCHDYCRESGTFYNSRGDIAGTMLIVWEYQRIRPGVGNKLSDRAGSKGVIIRVRKDEEMPVNEFGERADVIASSIGVAGRANIQQLFEMFYNYASRQIIHRHKKNGSSPHKDIIKYISMINREQATMLKNHPNSQQILDEMVKTGNIPLNIPSFPNYDVGIKTVARVIDTFKIKRGPVYMKRSIRGIDLKLRSSKKVDIAEKYTLLLCHTPQAKYSARSTGPADNQGVPVSGKGTNRITNPHTGTSLNPIKSSELMTNNYFSIIKPKYVSLFHALNSYNTSLRKRFVELKMKNPDPYTAVDILKEIDSDIINRELHTKNVVAEKIKELFRAFGVRLMTRIEKEQYEAEVKKHLKKEK